jgi:hypothetical protein
MGNILSFRTNPEKIPVITASYLKNTCVCFTTNFMPACDSDKVNMVSEAAR